MRTDYQIKVQKLPFGWQWLLSANGIIWWSGRSVSQRGAWQDANAERLKQLARDSEQR